MYGNGACIQAADKMQQLAKVSMTAVDSLIRVSVRQSRLGPNLGCCLVLSPLSGGTRYVKGWGLLSGRSNVYTQIHTPRRLLYDEMLFFSCLSLGIPPLADSAPVGSTMTPPPFGESKAR